MRQTQRILWAVALALLLVLPQRPLGQSLGTVMPSPKFTGFDDNGDPLNGGKLCTYLAGTSTTQKTYSNVDLAVIHENANPVILDVGGRATVFLSPGASYKFVLRTAGSSPLECTTGSIVWTQDNVSSTPASATNFDITGLAGEAIAAGNVVYLSDGSGSKNAGQWYIATSANTYSSSAAVKIGFAPSAIASGSLGSVRLAGEVTGLVTSSGTTYFVSTAGALTSTAPTNRRQLGIGNSATSLLIDVEPTSVLTDGLIRGPLKGYMESYQMSSVSAGTVTIDYASGNHVGVPLTANVTTITVTNVPACAAASTCIAPLMVYWIGDGTPRTVTSTINGTAVRWPNATAPVFAGANALFDRVVYTFVSTLIVGDVVAQAQ